MHEPRLLAFKTQISGLYAHARYYPFAKINKQQYQTGQTVDIKNSYKGAAKLPKE